MQGDSESAESKRVIESEKGRPPLSPPCPHSTPLNLSLPIAHTPKALDIFNFKEAEICDVTHSSGIQYCDGLMVESAVAIYKVRIC